MALLSDHMGKLDSRLSRVENRLEPFQGVNMGLNPAKPIAETRKMMVERRDRSLAFLTTRLKNGS